VKDSKLRSSSLQQSQTEEQVMFFHIIKEWSMMDQVCNKYSEDTFVDIGSPSCTLNGWHLALKNAGEVVARASLDGPIGLVDVMDFHSGNYYILERGCTMLAMESFSPKVLISCGFVEVAIRSLRKGKPAHPFYLSTLVKTISLIIKTFEGEQQNTIERFLNQEGDTILCDCLAWADFNAGAFLPVLKTVADSWTLAMRPSLTLLCSANLLSEPVMKDHFQKDDIVRSLSPNEHLNIIATFNGWAHIRTKDETEGWLKMVGLRRSCVVPTGLVSGRPW
jgi:hypothetical protein